MATSTIRNIDINSPLDLVGNLEVATRSTVIELKSTYGLSTLRDITTSTGTGSVVNAVGDAEFNLSTGATTGSDAKLESAERGRYVPGTQGQVGLGVRFPSQTFTGTAKSEWGYFDTNNGFGYGVDTTGVYIFILRDGTQTKVYQTNWNNDTLDGNGASGLTLALTDGNVYQTDYLWYGYGNIDFKVVLNDGNKQTTVTIHRFNPTNQTSVKDPNLPISALIDNGDTTTDYQMFIAGRQYATYTPYDPNFRINGHYRISQGSIGTTFIPVISFKRKTAYKSVAVLLEGLDIKADTDMLYQIRVNGSLTGASYGTPNDTTASETACEADTTASAITGGEPLYTGLLSSTGAGLNSAGFTSNNRLDFDIPNTQPLTLCLKTLTGTGTATSVLRWREEW